MKTIPRAAPITVESYRKGALDRWASAAGYAIAAAAAVAIYLVATL